VISHRRRAGPTPSCKGSASADAHVAASPGDFRHYVRCLCNGDAVFAREAGRD
jgi:hypothetical protein